MPEGDYAFSREGLGNLEPLCREKIWEGSEIRDFPAGISIVRENDNCVHLPIVLSGSLRVYKVAESGREITLYGIDPGSSCVLSASGILMDTPFPAEAVTEKNTRVLLVPGQLVRELYDKFPSWRDFILSLYTDRVSSIIHLVEDVLFRRLDRRLAEFLLDREVDGEVRATHKKIAEELGSTREVISRLLKDFSVKGYIASNRGEIRLEKPEELRKIADNVT